MVDDNAHKTLFQLVEVGKGADAVRLAKELPARAIVVDIALPALPALGETPGRGPQSPGSTLILLNVRTVTGTVPSVRPRTEPVPPDAAPPE